MSDIWPSGDPMTQPPRWAVNVAGLALVLIAGGSLALGLFAGWQRGEPRNSPGGAPAQASSNAVDAVPLNGPEVTLRDDSAPDQPAAAEASKVETPEETETPVVSPRTGNAAPAEETPAARPAPEAQRPAAEAPAPETPPAAQPEAPPAQTPQPSSATPF